MEPNLLATARKRESQGQGEGERNVSRLCSEHTKHGARGPAEFQDLRSPPEAKRRVGQLTEPLRCPLTAFSKI